MTTLGVDYSTSRPSRTVLGPYAFACRYLTGGGKALTRQEADQLASWGKWIVSNYETTGVDYQGGFAAGVTAATRAAAAHLACGGPGTRPIYFSIDADTTYTTAVAEYFKGVNSVIGVARTGVYGDATVIQGLFRDRLAAWGWRTESTGWSGGASTVDCALAQLVEMTLADGSDVDVNQALTSDYGQWQPGVVPFPPPAPAPIPIQEDDMITTSDVTGRAGISWSAGSKHRMQVTYSSANVPTFALDVELVLTTGPWYSTGNAGPWQLVKGSGTWEIPTALVATCRGVILRWSGSSERITYDVFVE